MSGQERHEDLARPRIAHRGILCRPLVGPQVRAVEEHHAALNTSLRHVAEQTLSDAGTGPAEDPKGRACEHRGFWVSIDSRSLILLFPAKRANSARLTSTMRLVFETTMERRRKRASQCR